jgi:hypothetical protein
LAQTHGFVNNVKLGSAGTQTTVPIQIPAGPHRLLVVACVKSTSTNPPTVATYNGVAMTAGPTVVDAGGASCSVVFWYIIDPPVGTANAVVTHTSNVIQRVIASSYAFDGLPIYDAVASVTKQSGLVASDLTTIAVTPTMANSLIVEATLTRSAVPQTAVGASQTALANVDEGAFQTMSSHAIGMAATLYNMTHFASGWNTAEDYAGAAIVFKETPPQEILLPPAAVGSGAAAAPTVVALVPPPASGATGGAAPSTQQLTVLPPAASALGRAAEPTLIGSKFTIEAPSAGASGSAAAPTVAVASTPAAASAVGTASAPTMQMNVLPPAASAMGAAAPTIIVGPGEYIQAPSAGATGRAAVPTVRQVVLPPSASALGGGALSTQQLFMLPPAARATGGAAALTLRFVLMPIGAAATGGTVDIVVNGVGDFALPVPIVTSGAGGGVTMEVSLWRATIDNVMIEDLSNQGVEGGVSMNLDREIKLSATFTIPDPDRVTPYRDYLAPFLTLIFDDGSPTIHRQLGLFSLRVPPATRGPDNAVASFTGEDLTTILANSAYAVPDEVPIGTLFRNELIQTILEAGITRYSIPNTTRTTGYHRTYPTGTTRMNKITRLTERMRMYQPYMDLEGRIATQNTFSKRVTEPYITLTDEDLLADIEIQPSDLQIANVIIVVRNNANEAPLTGVARDDDASSPTSTVSIGREIVRVVPIQELEDQNDADEQARRYLEEGKSYYRTAKLVTMPNAHFGFHQVLDLALTGDWAALNGRWMVRSWDIGFSPESVALVQGVNQLTSSLSAGG